MAEALVGFFSRILSVLPFDSLQVGFIQRAFLCLAFLSPLCGALGSLVVQFRMAFFSDSVAHSAFTGVAIGLLLGINPWYSVIVFGVLAGIAAIAVRRRSGLAMDTTLGVVFSTTVALGLAIISSQKGLAKTLPGFLYGDILAIGPGDVLQTFFLLLGGGVFLVFFFNRLLFLGIHEHLARISGVWGDGMEMSFGAILALVVTFSIRAVGILLVTALLVIPAAAARNFARDFRRQVWLAILFGWIASFAGLATSVVLDTATGASIILWASGIFLLSLGSRAVFPER